MAFRTLISRKTLGLGLVLQNESMNLLGLGFSHARKLQISYLTYDYGVLESAISGKIMKVHHQKHHQTYRTIYNKASKQLDKAMVEVDVSTVVKLQSEIKFNGEGISILFGGRQAKNFIVRSGTTHQLSRSYGGNYMPPYFSRSLASRSASESPRQTPKEQPRKDISTVDDPFDAPTYNIPEKPVSFAEGASYSVIILAGLGVAAIAGYAVFKELIFQPKEYKIFGKALERVQNDSQVTVRIGSPVTGYGQESRNRAARQRIPNRTWTDEDGIEHIEVNFYIRGPHGSGKVYSEMFKDKVDKQWKFTYLIVEIKSPSPTQLMLESYVPA